MEGLPYLTKQSLGSHQFDDWNDMDAPHCIPVCSGNESLVILRPLPPRMWLAVHCASCDAAYCCCLILDHKNNAAVLKSHQVGVWFADISVYPNVCLCKVHLHAIVLQLCSHHTYGCSGQVPDSLRYSKVWQQEQQAMHVPRREGSLRLEKGF